MPEIALSLSYGILIVFFAALAAVFLSVYAYHVTIPPISRALKVLLISLRASGLFIIFLLLAEPLLSIINRTSEPPIVSVLIDHSKSMTIEDNGESRSESVHRFLTSKTIQQLSTIGDVQVRGFDSRLHRLELFDAESLRFAGEKTDIANTLRELKQDLALQNVQSIVIVSDGVITEGANPLIEAEELGVPIFTIGIGDTLEKRDVLVRKVLTNDLTYVGNNVPVLVNVKSSGFDKEKVEVMLESRGKILDRKFVSLQGGSQEYRIPLTFVPDSIGNQKLTVSVSELPGETITKNNRYPFFIKVLKSKMKVLLIAGSPSADAAFIRRAMESDKNIDVRTFVERPGGGFYEGALTQAVLDEAECMILAGFPTVATEMHLLSALQKAGGDGKGLFVVLSRTVDLQKMKQLESILPFTILSTSTEEYQAFVSIPDHMRNNIIVSRHSEPALVELWSKLPPLFKQQAMLRAKPESDVIAFARLQTALTDEPVLVSRKIQNRKSAALLGYGIWRWKMYADGIPGASTVLEDFLSNTIRWLTTREDDRRIRVSPLHNMFADGAPIEFDAHVYDESLNPIEQAAIKVLIEKGNQQFDLMLAHMLQGQYEGRMEGIPEGDYRYHAAVSVNGKTVGEDRGTFSVGGLNIEFHETRMNKELLQQIAFRSRGKYYDAKDYDRLHEDIKELSNFKHRVAVRESEISLWNSTWVYVLIVFLFSTEWFLRKRSGML